MEFNRCCSSIFWAHDAVVYICGEQLDGKVPYTGTDEDFKDILWSRLDMQLHAMHLLLFRCYWRTLQKTEITLPLCNTDHNLLSVKSYFWTGKIVDVDEG